MSFHEVRFPASLSFGSSGGPERRTDIVTLTSGHEERNSPWAGSRRRYDAGLGVRSLDELSEVIAFFEARQGQLYGFRWKDWGDFKSCQPSKTPSATDQQIGLGDGVQQVFQLVKAYGTYARDITKPVVASVVVAVDGVAASAIVDDTTGQITFDTAPSSGAVITAGFEFDVPVRFDTDHIHISAAGFQAGQMPDVPIIEVRV